jgi:hypothetical protein
MAPSCGWAFSLAKKKTQRQKCKLSLFPLPPQPLHTNRPPKPHHLSADSHLPTHPAPRPGDNERVCHVKRVHPSLRATMDSRSKPSYRPQPFLAQQAWYKPSCRRLLRLLEKYVLRYDHHESMTLGLQPINDGRHGKGVFAPLAWSRTTEPSIPVLLHVRWDTKGCPNSRKPNSAAYACRWNPKWVWPP